MGGGERGSRVLAGGWIVSLQVGLQDWTLWVESLQPQDLSTPIQHLSRIVAAEWGEGWGKSLS